MSETGAAIKSITFTPTDQGNIMWKGLPSLSVMNREEILRQCLRDDTKEEFDRLNLTWTHAIHDYVNTCEEGPFRIGYDNARYNRYADVLSFDDTLVVLEGRGKKSSYINASWVDGKRYIVTQGPMQTTIGHFWTMVWQQNCSVIVNLTRRFENGREKCAGYWVPPHRLGDKEVSGKEECDPEFYIEGTRVVLIDTKTEFEGNLVIRKFVISRGEGELGELGELGEKRNLTQIHYREWPDFGLPASTAAMRRVVDLTDEYNTSGNAPIIHCSAGVGRAGTFVALHSLSRKLDRWGGKREKTHDEPIEWDISASLLKLRTFRPGLVQTADQFAFLHRALYDHMTADSCSASVSCL